MDKKFLEANIIEVLGLESLPDEQKIKMVQQMTDLAQKRIMLRIMEHLSEKEKDEFEKILGGPDVDLAAAEFIQNKVPNFDEMIKEEIVKVKQELIEKFGVANLSR
jgi:succinate dehydrogenase flavin-adding protein (antitoxin of CptAB toxin-antitoxin module)